MASICVPQVPSGNGVVARAMLAFSTQVYACLISSVTGPRAMVRVMSVVPQVYCAPESMSSSPSALSGAFVSGVAI